VHELGHATALVHFGRRVRGAGFRIYFGTPAFFIDSSDVLMIDRGPRIAQSFAGPYFEMVATAVVALGLWAWPDSSVAPALYSFVILSGFVLFLNFVPLLELDGYWILSDAIRVPDLRPRSLAFVRRDLWAKLARRDPFTFSEVGLGLYGTLGVAFTIFCLWSAVFFWRRTVGGFVTNTWEAGPAGVFALLVLAAFLVGPVVRALVDFGRVVSRHLAGWLGAARFRGQRHWRIEAAELLDAQPGFDDLPVDVLEDIAGRVELRRVSPGTVVARQGERSDAYYLVRRGKVEVIEENPETGAERLLRTLGPGESFGEIGVATGAPRRATVRSATPVDLFVIGQGSFDRLLADHLRLPELAPTLQALAEVRSLGPFAQLGTEELDRVLEQGSWHSVAPGEAIVTQGEVGDAFFAIESGHFEVTADDEVQGSLGPGDHFGEVALLIGVARTATVRAVTPGRVFRLERVGFDRLLAGAFRRGRLISRSPVTFERE
jgi:CRP-like cAMP-binding protein